MTLLQYLKVNRYALLYMIFWQTVLFCVGVAMVLIINATVNDEMDYACMGTMFSIIGVLVGALTQSNLNGNTRFGLAVSMGMTRRSYLLCSPLVVALNSLGAVVWSWLLWRGENWLYAVLYPGYENDISFEAFFRWQIVLLTVVLLVVLELGLSALIQRFGMKGFLPIWLCCCSMGILLPRAADAYKEGGASLLAKLGGGLFWLIENVAVPVWIGLAMAALVAILTGSVLVFRRAEPKL